MAPHHENYILKVTVGSTYDVSKHTTVPVNTEKPTHISSEHLDAKVHVRVKDYRGLPENSPSTSPYFSTPQHPYDRYSIGFSFTPKAPIAGDALVFGNDFDHPIRDRLPPLFDKAFGIVKWWIDPGLDGDVYGDEPYLYGPLLSSMNVLDIAPSSSNPTDESEEKGEDDVEIYTENTSASSSSLSIPGTSAARQKFFLTQSNRENFTFEKGTTYNCDFFNPYLDFNEFALKLGYGMPAISIIGHWDGQPLRTHSLRYVLKNRATGTELLVVIFTLIPTEQAQAAVSSSNADDGDKKESTDLD